MNHFISADSLTRQALSLVWFSRPLVFWIAFVAHRHAVCRIHFSTSISPIAQKTTGTGTVPVPGKSHWNWTRLRGLPTSARRKMNFMCTVPGTCAVLCTQYLVHVPYLVHHALPRTLRDGGFAALTMRRRLNMAVAPLRLRSLDNTINTEYFLVNNSSFSFSLVLCFQSISSSKDSWSGSLWRCQLASLFCCLVAIGCLFLRLPVRRSPSFYKL